MLDRTTPSRISIVGDLTLPVANHTLLANGMPLCWYDAPTSQLVQLSLVVGGGLAEGRLPAIASILAATITEGAAGRDSEQVAAEIDYYGARLRAEASTHFVTLTLEALTDKLPHLLPLFVDIVTRPDLPDDIFLLMRDREAKVVKHVAAQVSFLALAAVNPLLMGADNPLAHTQTVDEVLSVGRDEIVDFHRRWWVARNMQAYLFGQFAPDTLALVTEALGAIAAGIEAPLHICPFHPQAPQRVDVYKDDAQQSAVRMALPAVPRTHPDYLPLRFAVIALGGYFGSRLMKNIREDKGYTYGIQASLAGQLDGSGIMVAAQCDASYVDAVIAETGAEMRRLATEPIDDDEMQRVKQQVSASLINTVDTTFTLADYYRLYLITGIPADYFSRQVELVHTLTPDLLMAMAARYFRPDDLRIAVAGKQ